MSLPAEQTNRTVGAAGESFSVAVNATADCNWNVESQTDFITVAGDSARRGPGTVEATVGTNGGGQRTGQLRVAGVTINVTQTAAECALDVRSSVSRVGSAGGTGTLTITVTQGANCAWRVEGAPSFITFTSDTSGTGAGTVTFTVQANPGQSRTASMTVAGRTIAISQDCGNCDPPPGCVFAVNTSGGNVPASGGTVNVTVAVTQGNNCPWSVSGGESWTTPSISSGTGNGTVTITVAANTGAERTSTLTVAGRTVSLTQACGNCNPLPCAYVVDSTALTFPAAGSSQTVTVTVTQGTGCSWSVSGGASWATPSTSSGTGTGSVTITAAANAGAERTATLTIAGRTVSLTQSCGNCSGPLPCLYNVGPTSLTFPAAAGSQPVTVTVTQGSGCTWTTSGDGSAGWASLSAPGGTGTGTVSVSVQANTGTAARTANLSIAGQAISVTQSGVPLPCMYSVSMPTSTVAGGGGTSVATVTVTQGSNCTWSVTGLPSWISANPSSQTGSGTTTLTAAANSSNYRSANFSIAGQSLSLNQQKQSSVCDVRPSSSSLSFGPSAANDYFNVVDYRDANGQSTGADCFYTVSSDAAWLTPARLIAEVNISVTANTGAERTGRVTIQGQNNSVSQSFTVTQRASGSLLVEVSPANAAAAAAQRR